MLYFYVCFKGFRLWFSIYTFSIFFFWDVVKTLSDIKLGTLFYTVKINVNLVLLKK